MHGYILYIYTQENKRKQKQQQQQQIYWNLNWFKKVLCNLLINYR